MQFQTVDRKTILDLKKGDSRALTKIYSLYSDQVYQLGLQLLKDTGWSEDLVQDVFVKLWENSGNLQDESPIWPYLYTMAKRESLNKLRSIKRSEAAFDRLLQYVQRFPETGEEKLINKELAVKIGECFADLPLQQERAVMMCKVEGMSYKEIAEELQISPNTVKNHIVKALKALRNSSLNNDALSLLWIMHLLEKY